MAADEKPRWVRIGRVARPHGIRGELLIRADDPDSTSLLDQDELFLRDEKGAVEKRRIASARVHRGDYRIVLEGLDDRDAAEALKGREVLLDRGALPDIEADEFYVADLVGLEVVGPEGGLGRVARVLDTGGVPILEVRGGRELQVPLADAFVKKIDVAAGRIEVEPPQEDEEGPDA